MSHKRSFSQTEENEGGNLQKKRRIGPSIEREAGELEDEEENEDSNDIFGGFFGDGDEDSNEDGDVDMQDNAKDSSSGGLMSSQTSSTPLAAPKGMAVSSIALKMMARMGHRDGQGLGKTGQGISTAIEATVRGRRMGLGHEPDPSVIQQRRHEYDNYEEKIEIKPDLHYIPVLNHERYDIKTLNPFLRYEQGVNKTGDVWDGTFGDEDIQQDLVAAKDAFNSLSGHAFRSARSRSNPFESIRGEIFQNRAALKICEMDVLSDMAITQPKNLITYQKNRAQEVAQARKDVLSDYGTDISVVFGQDFWARELIYFADVCAGPGGFTEYFLHVHKWQCRGFGFTLKGDEDFRPDKFNKNAPFHTFSKHYGKDQTGDVTNSENVTHFRTEVLKATGSGVHTVTADGGFDVSADFNSQELLSRRLVMCQFLTAFGILRKGGTFVCKLFDTFWPFTSSIIYCARMYFEKVALVKPNQSRPANSERYVICTGYLLENRLPREGEDENGGMPDIVIHLLNANRMWPEADSHQCIAPIIPVDKMDPGFIDFVRDYNNEFARREIFHLRRLLKYVEDPNLRSDDQASIRKQCLDVWFGKSKRPRIFMDQWFGHTYVTNKPNSVPGIDRRARCRPAKTLFEPPTTLGGTRENYGGALLRRIQFTLQNLEEIDFRRSFADKSDFRRYPVSRNWFTYAFGLKPRSSGRSSNRRRERDNTTMLVVLIGTPSGVYEMRRVPQSNEVLNSYGMDFDHHQYAPKRGEQETDPGFAYPCTCITNRLVRLPPDTVIDCVRIVDEKGVIKYNMIDAWVIGSKKVWERDFVERREFLRLVYQGFGSEVLCLPGPRSVLTTLRDERLARHRDNLFVLFVRTRRSTKPYGGRPVAMKVWTSGGVGGSLMGLREKLEEIDASQ